MTTTPHRIAALVLAAVLGTAACTSSPTASDHEPNNSADHTATATPSPSPPPKFTGVQHRLPTGKALRNDSDLYETVNLTNCGPTAKGWMAAGTATNSTDEPIDYRITIFFTDAHARTVDSARAKVNLAAGQTSSWRATRRFTAPRQTHCVVRAVDNAS